MGNLKNGVVEMVPDERFDNFTPAATEQQRLQTLEKLNLLESGSLPVFEEATQTAAHLLNAPICVLGILDRDRVWFKSAVGLSRIGLMNSLATSRQMPRQDAFCAQVAEDQRLLSIPDAAANDSAYAHNLLVQRYGIRSYLGVPLIAANGHCIGSLAVMGLAPRLFSEQDIAFLELIGRWAMSEFERDLIQADRSRMGRSAQSLKPVSVPVSASIKTTLLSQMTQELSTPLTSILGMAKVLNQGIYASRPEKQQEYIQIIHNSGQYLLSLVNEIMELGALEDQNPALNLAPVDIEMLCQQAIGTLQQIAQRREQQIQLTVEPGNRIWTLDKDKVRQMLYHLVFSVVQSASSESVVRLHVSRRQQGLQLAVWASHPWLGEGISSIEPAQAFDTGWAAADPAVETRQSLGLSLSRQLAELHGGEIAVQGNAEAGYRYVLHLPQLSVQSEVRPEATEAKAETKAEAKAG
jgi:hypothetical protein